MSDSGSMNLDLGVNLGVTLDGAGLQELSNTIKEISKGKDLQRYWKDVESATDSAAKAIQRYNKNVNSKGLAENLLKQINALKALTKKENLSELFPNTELNLDELVESAKKIVPQISSQFSVDSFSQAFKTFDLLKEKSIDLSEAFRMLSKYAELVDDNLGLRKENSQFRELIGDSDVEEVKSKLLEIKRLRDQAEEIFTSFLKVNNVERTDYWGDEKFSDYFDAIRKGSLTATEAISRFKTEYAYLLEDGFKSNNDTFGLEQLQAFSNKLDSIFRQVEETSTKINDIISNGVITKSVENLSMDSSLSDSQRSLFGNLLQDEESLKSITALFQKLIEESNKTSKVDLFNDEQLQQVLSIFDKMEGHLSSLKSIISDVGDGEEFSPLLKMINNVQSSISELATNVKGIGLNMNIDVGSDDELDRKLQTKVANALQAYQKLFNNIKMTSAGGSLINQDFFDFNLDNYDTAYQKLQAIVNFIKKQRVEAKKQFNGYDALYEDSDKSLWKSAQAYLAQVTKAETEIKKANSGESNPLDNLFGNTKDLSEVIEQLNKVVEKLNEISSSATEFKNVFKEGFNVTASVEEIDKLTNRVKELEDELSKVKVTNTSQIEDVFQGDAKVNTDASTTAIKEESQALEKVSASAKDAASSKENFANANKEVKASADETVISVDKEISALEKAGNRFKSQAAGLAIKPDNQHQFSSWKKQLEDLNIKIAEYKSKVENLSKIDIADEEQIKKAKTEIEGLGNSIKDTITVMSKTSQSDRGWTQTGVDKLIQRMNDDLKKNSNYTKETRRNIEGLIEELKNIPDRPLSEVFNDFSRFKREAHDAGKEGKAFFEIFKEKVIYGGAAQLAGMVGFYDVINVCREGFETIKEYDNALTEMNKVSKESIETLKDFQKESFGLSDEIGTTASQIQNSTADFLRLGESFEQAKQSAQDANALFKVAEFDNIDEATEALVAMSQAYKELDKSQINDVLNYTGNNFSISTSELASALQRSAATLKVAGNDIYEATALVTAGNAVLQDAEAVGTGLKMISLRLLGTEEAKNELASLGEDVDDFVVQTQSKIDETVRSYTAVASNAFKGISVLDENGNYRSTYEILRDISLVYQEILEADKKAGTNRGQALLEVLAGKNRSNVAASILQSPELLTSVYEEAMNNSQGSVAKELESQLQSIETHLNQLKNSWDKLWVNENNREVINFFLDLAKGILEVVDDIGVLNTAFIGIGAGLGIKNIGKTYECMDFKIIC